MSGRRAKNTGGTTRDVNAAVRAQAAIKLYMEGVQSWDDIAAQAGYASRGAAHNAVQRELDRCVTRNVQELRDKQYYMLATLQARCYKAGIDEKNTNWTWAVDRFVTLSKRISELMGLDQERDAANVANQIIIREIPHQYLGEVKSE